MSDSNSVEVSQILRFVAPGTQFREGLENVLRAKTGALIVVGHSESVMKVVDGGFFINCEFTPTRLYELAKMDGAIIVSEDGKKILYANTQLVPESSIPSSETGIRHRAAERAAKQTGHLVISISQRRNIITLYQGNFRYTLKDINVILSKANQAIQTLEKYKTVLDRALTNLGALEFEESVTLHEVVLVFQRIVMVLRVKSEIINYINELGTEGRLVSMQLEELVGNIETEARYLIQDYSVHSDPDYAEKVLEEIKKQISDELLDGHQIVRQLGYPGNMKLQEEIVSPKGYRILSKIPRLPSSVAQNVIDKFKSLRNITMATIEQLDEVEGIGVARARMIQEGLRRIQEQVSIDRPI